MCPRSAVCAHHDVMPAQGHPVGRSAWPCQLPSGQQNPLSVAVEGHDEPRENSVSDETRLAGENRPRVKAAFHPGEAFRPELHVDRAVARGPCRGGDRRRADRSLPAGADDPVEVGIAPGDRGVPIDSHRRRTTLGCTSHRCGSRWTGPCPRAGARCRARRSGRGLYRSPPDHSPAKEVGAD